MDISILMCLRLSEAKDKIQINEFFEHLNSNTKNLDAVEVLFKLDNDDPLLQITIAELEKYKKKQSVTYFISPALDGYRSLHSHYNQLWENCSLSSKLI